MEPDLSLKQNRAWTVLPFFYVLALLKAHTLQTEVKGSGLCTEICKLPVEWRLAEWSPLPWGQLEDSSSAGKKTKVGELRLFISLAHLITHFVISADFWFVSCHCLNTNASTILGDPEGRGDYFRCPDSSSLCVNGFTLVQTKYKKTKSGKCLFKSPNPQTD